MSGFILIDLSKLFVFEVIKIVEYGVLLVEMKVEVICLMFDFEVYLLFESELII